MSYNHICEVCNVPFISRQPNAKVCGEKCLNEKIIRKSGRCVHQDIKISNGTVGAMAEVFVSGDLLKKGYSVFRALSPACYCDLIAVKDNKLLSIEVRTGYKALSGKFSFPTVTHGKIDYYGVYERNLGIIKYFDLELKEIII